MATAEPTTDVPPDPAAARARRAVLLFLTQQEGSETGSAAALDEIAPDLETIHLAKGDVLCRQGTASDRLFIIVSGRLRAVLELPDGTRRVLNEIGRGETIGEMGLLTGEPRSATVLASRDSELVALPKEAFERLILRHPAVLLRLTRQLIGRLSRAQRPARPDDELLTIALVPLAPQVPLADLAAGPLHAQYVASVVPLGAFDMDRHPVGSRRLGTGSLAS